MKYFHGVNLPTEPDTSKELDLSQYAYAFATKGKNSNGETLYNLFLYSKPVFFNPTTKMIEVETPYVMSAQTYYSIENIWVEVIRVDTPTDVELSVTPVLFWNDEVFEHATNGAFLVGINHDIVNTETGEVAFMVCDDVILPSIPSNIDRSLYPYAYVVKMQRIESANYFGYMLIVTDKPMQTNSDGTNVVVAGTKGYVGNVDVYSENQCEWISEETEISSDMPLEQDGYTMTLIWSEVAEEKLYSIKESTLKNIGNSIRGKTGKTELIPPEDMPSEIDGIAPKLQNKTITENGTYSADSGYDGLGEVMVNVLSSGGAELNIHYGDTEPSDTSMLWCKCAEPSKVLIDSNGADTTISVETLATTLSSARSGIACATVGKKIYLFGGYNGSMSNTIEVFDTETETTSVLSTTLHVSCTGICCATVGKKIYLFGGFTSSYAYINTIYVFDTETETITKLSTTVPTNIRDGRACAIGNAIYIFGGRSGHTTPLKTIYKFDTETETISSVSNMSQALYNVGVGVVANNIYFFGGEGTSATTNLIQRFDPSTNSCTPLSVTLDEARTGVGVGVVGANIYLFGGSASDRTVHAPIQLFNPANETIETLEVAVHTSVLQEMSIGVVGANIYILGGQGTNFISNISKFIANILVKSGLLKIKIDPMANLFNILNGDITMEIGVSSVYLGNSDGVGEPVDAFLYKDGAWTQI